MASIFQRRSSFHWSMLLPFLLTQRADCRYCRKRFCTIHTDPLPIQTKLFLTIFCVRFTHAYQVRVAQRMIG
mgnify:CR=1 FL=1